MATQPSKPGAKPVENKPAGGKPGGGGAKPGAQPTRKG
jgi:hypothetical protein